MNVGVSVGACNDFGAGFFRPKGRDKTMIVGDFVDGFLLVGASFDAVCCTARLALADC